MDKLYFGTSGIPLSSPKDDSREGIKRIAELDLDAMELEFVQGVRIKADMADEIFEIQKDTGVKLTAHGPYWINLNAKEPHKVLNSRNHILNSARIGKRCGAWSVVFHAAFYLKQPEDKVYKRVKDELKGLRKILDDEDNDIWLRPETTGKGTQFGTLDEIMKLSEDIEGILPCTDFSHMQARKNKVLEFEDYRKMLSKLEKKLGRKVLDNMHIHLSGIEYGPKGEKRHLPLEESNFKYEEILRALKEFKAKGIVVCESPELENDAVILKNTYEAL
jgi:deoxyribonuclease-4